MREARYLEGKDLHVGLQAEFERDITAEDITAFAELSGDCNPLHIDEKYAAATNYQGRIVHGAFQVGLASAMAGMYLPGREVLVGSFQSRFPSPLSYPARVRVQGEITAWVPATSSGVLRVRVLELPDLRLTAEIHTGFSLHESRIAQSMPANEPAAASSDNSKPLVLLTGAGGALGQALASLLAENYRVLGMSRTSRPSAGNIEWVNADLTQQSWEHLVDQTLKGRRLHGLVHAAWPPGPEGSLLDVEPDAVRKQLEFGGALTIQLARFLRDRVAGGGRIVVLGTTAATIRPELNLSAYSLGKAALEHTVRLLAPELARSQITINLVAPSFVPAGMNAAKTSRVILRETAKVPMGKLCSPEDVARSVEFLLSPGAQFITGQMLPLTGGLL